MRKNFLYAKDRATPLADMKNNNKKLAGLDYKSIFNKLSLMDRLSLKSSALIKAVTDFIKNDTEDHPERYPAYVAYLTTIVATPPPVGAVLVTLTAAWAKYSASSYGQKLNEHIKGACNDEDLLHKHEEFLEPDPDKAGTQKVKSVLLAWDTSKKSINHSWQATKYAWNAIKKFTIK